MPRRIADELLKAVLEDIFPDFLRFIYPRAEEIFDFGKDIEFMDKELLPIFPDRRKGGGKRIADLLVKVHMKDGTEKCILVHTEIEGGRSKEFAYRMYHYQYRISERYGLPVEAIAVFTGGRKQERPSVYQYEIVNTSLDFRYLAYHIFDHEEQELLEGGNIFGPIVFACQKALDEGKVSDIEMDRNRLLIARALLRHKIDRDRIIRLLVFIKNLLFVENEELNYKFDEQILQLTDNTIDMGVIELIKRQEREKGIEKGIEKGEQLKALAIAKELKDLGNPFDLIAKVTGLSVVQIEEL